jgi:hypothetical protein
MDGQRCRDSPVQVLELYVYSTELTAKVATGVDYRGKSSANVHVAGGRREAAQHLRFAKLDVAPVDDC